jgi:pyruvate carboxylase subunit A
LDSIGHKDYIVPTNYDSMIGKLIVVGIDWDGVVRKARRALGEFLISGIPTNIPLHRQIVRDEDFKQGIFNTTFLDKKLPTFTLDAIQDIQEDEAFNESIAAIAVALKAFKK